MSLESVFAALAGVLILQERLSSLQSLRALLILAGVTLLEASPLLLEARARRSRPRTL
ncbi:hypothetical protein SBBP1_150009 [Burkholderiales bacterium]|nr:hypothetical protein SBBP1_150009 [Burkholderiales bacterium]